MTTLGDPESLYKKIWHAQLLLNYLENMRKDSSFWSE